MHTCSEEARSNGYSVVIDGDIIHDFLMRPMIKALATIQVRPHPPVINTHSCIAIEIPHKLLVYGEIKSAQVPKAQSLSRLTYYLCCSFLSRLKTELPLERSTTSRVVEISTRWTGKLSSTDIQSTYR